jgi:hypothetical protein
MKKALLVSWAVIAALLYFTACSSDSGSDDDADDPSDVSVTKVTQITAGDVDKSGATTPISSEDELIAYIGALSEDTAIGDLFGAFSGAVPEYAIRGADIKRATTDNLNTFLANIKAALEKFPDDKTMDETYSQSNVALGNYYKAKKIEATIQADVTTTDSAAADFDEGSNLKSGTGKVTMNADIEQTARAEESYIVDSKFRINLSANGSCDTVETEDGRDPANLAFSAALSVSLAASLNFDGTGGILIINADAALPVTKIVDPTESDSFDSLAPTLAVSINMYDDAGTATFTKKFSDFQSFKTWVDALDSE